MRVSLLVLLLVVACGGSDSTGPSAPPPTLAGTWQVPVTIAGSIHLSGDPTAYPVTCSGTMQWTLTDASGAVSGQNAGTLNCNVDGSPATLDVSGTLVGTRTAKSFTLTEGHCTEVGMLANATTASGTMTCDNSDGTGTIHLSGPFNATR